MFGHIQLFNALCFMYVVGMRLYTYPYIDCKWIFGQCQACNCLNFELMFVDMAIVNWLSAIRLLFVLNIMASRQWNHRIVRREWNCKLGDRTYNGMRLVIESSIINALDWIHSMKHMMTVQGAHYEPRPFRHLWLMTNHLNETKTTIKWFCFPSMNLKYSLLVNHRSYHNFVYSQLFNGYVPNKRNIHHE